MTINSKADTIFLPSLFADYSWYYKVLVIIIGIIIINYLIEIILSKLYIFFTSSNHFIRKIIITSIKPPLHFYITSLGISEVIYIFVENFHFNNFKLFSEIKLELLVITLLWFSLRIINKFEYYVINLIKKNPNVKLDHTTVGALAITARISFFMISSLVVMDSIGVSISGILTFGGISGIIVGFASKDLLTNFFGALTIYLDKPFKVGDWIRLQEKNIEGTVEKIGLRCTLIKTNDKRPLYVPNSYFSSVPVENSSKMSHRHINETIGIDCNSVNLLEIILNDIRNNLKKNKNIDKKQNYGCNFTGYSTNSANILIFCFTKSIDYKEFLNIKEQILIYATEVITKHNAKISKLT